MLTTLNAIRKHSPCKDGWEKLLKHLGKTQADDEPISIATILDSNGINDALWCLRAVEGKDKDIRLYSVWCARQVQHLMKDRRSRKALDVAERYANGEATEKERRAAYDAAFIAASTARDARDARAASAAWYVVMDSVALAAAWASAAWAARSAAGAEMESRQEAELRRICEEG